MRTFEKYFEYVKKSFSMYEKISVDIKVQNNDTLIISIFPHSDKSHGIRGSLYFKFDQETVGFFGDFLPDDYIDWFDNSWEKVSEKYKRIKKFIGELELILDHKNCKSKLDDEEKVL